MVCLNVTLDKRNLILDQTNVYQSARKRKLKPFKDAGYKVIAAVLVTTDAELTRRSDKRTREDGKNVPAGAVLEMKANFKLPDQTEDFFDEVRYVELSKSESEKLVQQYNDEAQGKRYPRNEQKKGGGRGKGRGRGGGRRGFDNRPDYNKPMEYTSPPGSQYNRPHQVQPIVENDWDKASVGSSGYGTDRENGASCKRGY